MILDTNILLELLTEFRKDALEVSVFLHYEASSSYHFQLLFAFKVYKLFAKLLSIVTHVVAKALHDDDPDVVW